MTLTAIVLAAGQGSRFRAETGEDKLLAQCSGRDGVTRPVIEHVLLNLPEQLVSRLLVTSPERSDVIRLARAYGCEVVLLQSAGMGDSIAAAIAASASADGWLVVLGDMPFVLPATIERVIDDLQSINVPVHAGQRGQRRVKPRLCGERACPDAVQLRKVCGLIVASGLAPRWGAKRPQSSKTRCT